MGTNDGIGLWILMVGAFIAMNAWQSCGQRRCSPLVEGVRVADAMYADPPTARASDTVADFLRSLPATPTTSPDPVIGDHGRVTGVLTANAIRAVPSSQWEALRTVELAFPMERITVVRTDEPLLNAIQRIDRRRRPYRPGSRPRRTDGRNRGTPEPSAIWPTPAAAELKTELAFGSMSAPTAPSLPTYRRQGDVGIITLDDGKANVMSTAVVDTLHAHLDQVESDGARALVLMGRPGKFSAGFDLSEMTAGVESMRALVVHGARWLMRLYGFGVPTVAACSPTPWPPARHPLELRSPDRRRRTGQDRTERGGPSAWLYRSSRLNSPESGSPPTNSGRPPSGRGVRPGGGGRCRLPGPRSSPRRTCSRRR